MNPSGHSPVYGTLQQPSMVDFPGKLAAVLFVAGCNFRCGYCHNAGLLGTAQPGFPWTTLDERCRHWREQWVAGVVVSGGEPTLRPDLPDLLEFLRARGFTLKLDTNGSRPASLAAVLPMLDYVAMDVKCSLETYPVLTGFTDPACIAESVRLLREGATDYELRTTVIESLHTAAEVERMRPLVAGAKRLVLQPFLPRADLPDPELRTARRTSPQFLAAVAARLQDGVDNLIVRG